MKIKLFFLFIWWCIAFSLQAQNYEVSGKAVTGKRQAVEFASVAVLRMDSTFVGGVMTDETGRFKTKLPGAGEYILKVSFIGYQPYFKNIHLMANDSEIDAGLFYLNKRTTLLGTATVTAMAAKVEQVADTTMFNAAAYRVPEGSTLEALVKQLPGVEIEDDGSISWNGKQIKEFLVNGKDFFKGDIEIALQNLPSDWISKIKAYEKQSDYTERTGIDDGEEYPVLDIVTKRELNQTIMSRLDGSYGTDERYFEKLFLSRFTDHSRVSVYGSLNNVNDKSFGGKRKRQGGGLATHQNTGVDFFWNNKRGKREAGRFEVGGNFNYNHVNTNGLVKTESEEFLSSGHTSTYRSAVNHNLGSTTNINTQLRLDWNPDTMTTVQFRPSFSHMHSSNGGDSRGATFRDDPFMIEGMVSPLDSLFAALHMPWLDSIAVNRTQRLNEGNRESNNVNASLNIVRRLGSRGRNVSLQVSGGYNRGENSNFTISNTTYYNGRQDKYINQYTQVPSTRWNYQVQFGYTEPITSSWFADLRYSFKHSYDDNERSRYNLDRLDPIYGTWCDSIDFPNIGSLPDATALQTVRDSINSQSATYRYFNHSINLGIRYRSRNIRFNVGVNVNPERTKMGYLRPVKKLDTIIVRKVCNIFPQLNFKYNLNRNNSLEFRYRGKSVQPSMTNLLAVVDNSHPLNVTMGNPGLEPSWNNSFDLGFRGYRPVQQQGMALGFNFTQNKNAVSQLSVYDESTGVRYHRPQNINGNWNTRINLMFNSGLGKQKKFTLSTNANLIFNRAVGYISSFSSGNVPTIEGVSPGDNYQYYEQIFDGANVLKNTTKTLGVRERLNLNYRHRWLECGIFGMVNFNHSRSDLRPKNDRDTWNYGYGLTTNLNFDCGFALSTDFRVNSRRGFPNATMNTDEWLWNAQLSYSFLRKKAATLSLQCYDILKQQSNFSHMISANRRSDSWNNDVHSYCLLHFIYKFQYIGGKKKHHHKNYRQQQREERNKSILDDSSVMGEDM